MIQLQYRRVVVASHAIEQQHRQEEARCVQRIDHNGHPKQSREPSPRESSTFGWIVGHCFSFDRVVGRERENLSCPMQKHNSRVASRISMVQ